MQTMTEKAIGMYLTIKTPEEFGLLATNPSPISYVEAMDSLRFIGQSTSLRAGNYEREYSSIAQACKKEFPDHRLERRSIVITEEGMVVDESGQRMVRISKQLGTIPFLHLRLVEK